ncbi:MAG TPA: hypothetical protein ENF87_02970, partial [Thermoproteales archaeon]|nr:hypothetical protein [Thermoproteales archaeon]
IDWNACKNSKENAIQNNVIVDVVQADVATAFRENVFRLVIANPPYLPLKRREKMLNIAAGEELEILEKFVKTSATCLKRSEVLLITTSTLTPLKGFKGICEKYGFRCEEYFSKRTLVDKIIVFKCVKL